MNKKIKIGLPILLLFAIVLSLSLVSSASVLVSPLSSSTQSQLVGLNATGVALDNCTFYTYSPSTGNSSWVNLGTATNESSAKTAVYATYNTTNLEDSNDYYFNATCRNSTNVLHVSALTSSITIDNTDPTVPSALTPVASSIDTDGSVTFSGTVVDRTTTGCTLYFNNMNPGNPNYAMTYSGTTCTYTLSAVPEQTYQYYIRASDGTDTADSTATTFNVDKHTSAGASALLASQEDVVGVSGAEVTFRISNIFSPDNTQILIAIVIVGLLIWLVVKKK